MSHQYADLTKLVADLAPGSVGNTKETEALGRTLEGVSSFIDKFCRRPQAYFMPIAEGAVATERRFRGEGLSFLRISPHVGDAVLGHGIASDLYYLDDESGWIYAEQDTTGLVESLAFADRVFRDGFNYTVSAKWGFSETPAAIVEAARQLTLRTWQTGRGVFGQLTPGAIVIERAMPPVVEAILLEYRRREFERN